MFKEKRGLVIAIIALVVAISSLTIAVWPKAQMTVGAIGNMMAENYIPYVMYNDGYYSAKAISTTGALSGATLALSGAADIGTLTYGGSVNSSSTVATTATLAASDITGYSGLRMMPNGASLALTLPASSTLSTFAPAVGDTRTFFVQNASTTAGVLMTFTGGSGSILKRTSTSSPAELTSDTDGAAMVYFRVTRIANPAGGVGDLVFNLIKNAD